MHVCQRCGALTEQPPPDQRYAYCSECASSDLVRVIAARIYQINKAAVDRGTLSLWTVYDHPRDHPDGYIARRFETGGGLPEPKATSDAVTGTLVAIRESMLMAGLYCLTRSEQDEKTIIETWL